MMFKINSSIEKQLHNISIDNPEYNELWSTWNLNKQALGPILNAIVKDYPHFSLHDYTHSESILTNIERLLGNKNIEKLSPTDLWLILHVAYLHDFGMVILDTEIHDIWKSNKFQSFLREQQNSSDEDVKKAAITIGSLSETKENFDINWPLETKNAVTVLISAFCRDKHAEISKNYILDINNIWKLDLGHNGLIKKRLIALIGEISSIHTKSFENILNLHKESNGFKNDYVHPRLVASLLRLGDVLDLDNGRFNPHGNEIYGEMPKSSKHHFEKHEATKHVLVTNETIEVEADCSNDESYRETRKWFDSLKDETNNLQLHWNDIAPIELGRPPKLTECKILRNGTVDSDELSNLKFKISQRKAFELLEGSSIYSDKFACLREIIQNAEDTSKIQMWRDIKSGMFYCKNGIDKEKVINKTLLPHEIPTWIYEIYSINVSVERNEKNNAVVKITDHGTGITISTLKSICNVGESYRAKEETRKEIEEMPVWLRPTANFGIGLQSCFLITDKITILTNSQKDNSLKITFKSGQNEGYVNVETLKETLSRGSTVILEIDDNIDFTYNLGGFTARKIDKIEPFETNCIVMYKIVDSIISECDSSYFNIAITSKEMNFSQTIFSHFKSNEINYTTKNKFSYHLNETKDELSVWYENNFFKLNAQKRSRGIVNVFYKGKKINKDRIYNGNFVGFIIAVDIYGIPTPDAVSLNREKLNVNARTKVLEQLKTVISFYFDLLSDTCESIDSQDLIDTYFLTSWIYKKSFPSQLKNKLSKHESVQIIKYDSNEKKYILTKTSLKAISNKFPYLPYIRESVTRKDADFPDDIDEGELLEQINNSNLDKSQHQYIVVDDFLKTYLDRGNTSMICVNCNVISKIRIVDTSDTVFSPDEYTKKVLINDLVYNKDTKKSYRSFSKTRQAIPAFKDYEKLSVKIKGIYFIGFEEFSPWYIVSPISQKDAEKISEFTRDAFVEYITNQSLFKSIVEYVVKNNKDKDIEEQYVISDYKRLIGEYYDIQKAKENQPK